MSSSTAAPGSAPARSCFRSATVGLAPQDLKYKGEETETDHRPAHADPRACSIHRGTVTGSGMTRIGADCLLMAVVHVAHDCEIGDGVIMSNNVVMGGHVDSRRPRRHRRLRPPCCNSCASARAPWSAASPASTARCHPVRLRVRPAGAAARAQHHRPAPARARQGAAACDPRRAIGSSSPAPACSPTASAAARQIRRQTLMSARCLASSPAPSRHGLITTARRAPTAKTKRLTIMTTATLGIIAGGGTAAGPGRRGRLRRRAGGLHRRPRRLRRTRHRRAFPHRFFRLGALGAIRSALR